MQAACEVWAEGCWLSILILESDLFLKKKKNLFIYLFLGRGEGREKGRETSMCGCLLHAPYWGSGLQPRHMSWLGIEPATLWSSGHHSVHWATPARAESDLL